MISLRNFMEKRKHRKCRQLPGFAVFLFFRSKEAGTIRKIVLATPSRSYAARLAEYLRESEPGWDTSAFTHETALRIRLQEPDGIDVLLGHPALLRQAGSLPEGTTRIAALVEREGDAEGSWPELALFQPLSGVAAGIRGLLAETPAGRREGCQVLAVFSATGGAGKTTAALNLARQAGERGYRTLYLNLEPMNATNRLFGRGEPDSLSRMLYALQTDGERFAEQLARCVRYQPYLRSDFVDAPDHPGERAAMTPDLLEALLNRLKQSGRYDLIVADPDSGVSPWHARLVGRSDRVAWLVTDDWQSLGKTERLIAYWKEGMDGAGRISFVCSRIQGAMMNRWTLPASPAAALPYIPQWKCMADPVGVFGAASYCGVLDKLLDEWGWDRTRKEGHSVGELRTAGG